jgi:uncharacterized heparinase superfamily protein
MNVTARGAVIGGSARRGSPVRRLRGRTPDEFRVRTLQAVNACLERFGLSSQSRELSDEAVFQRLDPARVPQGLPSAEKLLGHFRARRRPQFFAGFADRTHALEVLRRGWPEAEGTTNEGAEQIRRGRFDLFGWHGVECDAEAPDWHLEPRSGKRAPLRHWSEIDFLDSRLVGDSKITWELNRHQYFSTLGRAYWYTGDEAYARTFVRYLTSWMDANPPKLGINWASSLELALRAVSWMWALHFFRQSSELSPPVFLRALKFLYLHARHLETYLSTYFSPNTHLTGEALGLFYLGILLPEFKRARRWRETGWRILREQLARQVRADGVYFEQATHYHRYTTDLYIHALVLGAANGLPVRGVIDPTLERLLDHLMYMTRPDGTTPFIGDDDGGQLVLFDERAPKDFRDTLATGAVLFRRRDYAYVAGEVSPQTLWLLGPAGVRQFHDLGKEAPRESSCAFRQGGYFVMRDGWTRDANFAVVDCGPHGALSCGHAHADALAVELVAHGCPFLVDAGTYTYTGSLEERNYFRSTAAHNTVTVDGESSSVPASTFRWGHTARSRPVAWVTHSRFDYFEGAHDGYARLAEPAIHSRSVLFLKCGYWVIRDRIESNGFHRVSVHFHCAPGVTADADGDRDLVLRGSDGCRGTTLRIAGFARGLTLTRARQFVSPSYGIREPATACVLTTEGEGRQEVVTFLLPGRSGVSERRAAQIDARHGQAFSVTGGEGSDTLLVGAQGGSEADGVAADADWAWVRRSARGAVLEFVVLAGSTLRVDGMVMFRADGVAGYVAGQLVDGEWHLDTDYHGNLTLAPGVELTDQCAASAG